MRAVALAGLVVCALGVVSLGSKMIDPPVVKRAQKTVEAAVTRERTFTP